MAGNFITIVPHIENLELRKDTGQIPYHFYKVLRYNATLVTYFYSLEGGRKAGPVALPPDSESEIHDNYPYLNSEVPGLKMHFLPYLGRKNFYEVAILNYLKLEAKNIDILNLFHLCSENIFYALYYKYKNPNGKVYIKLDIDIQHYKQQKSIFNVSGKFGGIKSVLYNIFLMPLFFNVVKLFSAESESGLLYFNERFKLKYKKLTLVPNGIDYERVTSLIRKINTFDEKENILLTVGRIGNEQKYHELLMKAISNIDLKDWKVYFVGPIEKNFEMNIAEFYQINTHLTKSVFFTGAINDPKALFEIYNRSKIFCMPSRWEGFPLSAVEAAGFGNVLLLSDQIFAFNTLTNYGSGGDSFGISTTKELSDLLKKYVDNPELLKEKHSAINAYAKNHFNWSNIVEKIDEYLNRN